MTIQATEFILLHTLHIRKGTFCLVSYLSLYLSCPPPPLGKSKKLFVEVCAGALVKVRHTSCRKADVEVVLMVQQVDNLEAIFLIARITDPGGLSELAAVDATCVSQAETVSMLLTL